MDDFTKLSMDAFLDRVADRVPTPGGGCVTGLAGALACSMARMVAAYSVNKKTEPAVRAQIEPVMLRLQRADQLMRTLISQDAVAYANMVDAAKAAKEDSSAKSAYADAVFAAISVPMEMAALASNALAAMDEFKGIASRFLLSDLGVAAVLADATAQAAAYSVKINAREFAEANVRTKILSNLDTTLAHCAHHRESIEATVRAHLESGPAESR